MELVLIMLFHHINVFDVFGSLSEWLKNLLRWFSNGHVPGQVVETIRHREGQMWTSFISLTDCLPSGWAFVSFALQRRLRKTHTPFQTQAAK